RVDSLGLLFLVLASDREKPLEPEYLTFLGRESRALVQHRVTKQIHSAQRDFDTPTRHRRYRVVVQRTILQSMQPGLRALQHAVPKRHPSAIRKPSNCKRVCCYTRAMPSEI